MTTKQPATSDVYSSSATYVPHVHLAGGIRRVTGTFSRPADNTAYTAGDLIGPSGTANLVTPITFSGVAPADLGTGRLTGCRAVVAPASGNLVSTNFAFDLLLFRPVTDIPFAAGSYPADNAALTVSAAAMRQLVGIFSFNASNWRSPAGSLSVAGVAGYQSQALNSSRPYAPFNLSDIGTYDLYGLVQAQAAWTPTGVVNQFDFVLDIEGN